MEINDALADKLANLSKLAFSGDEKKNIKKGLQEMISFVEKLNEVDTEGVEPLLHITPNKNVLRKDFAETGLSTEDALCNAHNKSNQFFLVPKVIKK